MRLDAANATTSFGHAGSSCPVEVRALVVDVHPGEDGLDERVARMPRPYTSVADRGSAGEAGSGEDELDEGLEV